MEWNRGREFGDLIDCILGVWRKVIFLFLNRYLMDSSGYVLLL